jgi:hypothetical protein
VTSFDDGGPNCLSGTYAGTAQHSEAESRNVIALATPASSAS